MKYYNVQLVITTKLDTLLRKSQMFKKIYRFEVTIISERQIIWYIGMIYYNMHSNIIY